MLSYQPTAMELLPIVSADDLPQVKGDYIYEPDPLTLLQSVLPRYVGRQIYRALLESAASELAARMTAMDAATKSAHESPET